MANKRQGIMLCYPFEEKRLDKWSPPYLVQPKLDGERARAVFDNQRQTYYLLSSTEHEITSCPHIVKALNNLGTVAELDGELYCHGMIFEDIYSRVSRTVNLHPDHEQIEFHIFDVVANGEQHVRTGWLNQQGFAHPLYVVSSVVAGNLDDIMYHYDHLLNKGFEGIIVRHIDAPYVRKRSVHMMKFKPKKDDWYTVVGTTEEIDKFGKPKGTLGALICQGDDGTQFSVGSGLTRDQRNELWLDRESLVGELCHVQYQHITPGKGVPRFPVFITVDRKEED
jgi:DNA ligase 1